MEPSRPGLPARAGARPTLSLRQVAAAGAAIALAISSRGDALLLVIVLGLLAADSARAVGVAGALVGSMLRWGTTSLGAIAGAQAVLGPAGWTGSGIAVASAWVGAAALVVATPVSPPTHVGLLAAAAPFGLAAGLVVVGPGPGGALPLRVIVALALITLAAVVSAVRDRGIGGLADVLAVVLGGTAALLGAAA